MSARNRQICLTILTFALFLVFCLISLNVQSEIIKTPRNISLRYHTATFSVSQIKGVIENEEKLTGEKLGLASYIQLDNQELSSKLYNRTSTAHVIAFYGDLRQILPSVSFQWDDYGHKGLKSCAVDSDTAYDLWGSTEIQGQIIEYQDEEFVVSEVFPSPKKTIAIPVDLQSKQKLNVLVLDTSQSPNALQSADEFRGRHSIIEPDASVSSMSYVAWTRFFVLFPVLLMILIILIKIIQELWRLRDTPFLCVIWAVVVIASAVVLFKWTDIQLSFPASLTPTRWSDFEFWNRLIQQWLLRIKGNFMTPRLVPDLLILKGFLKLICASITSTVSLCMAVHHVKTAYEMP